MPRKKLQDEAIIAALISEGSVKGAADSLGCNTKTVYARMRLPAFKKMYSQAKGDILKAATAKLQGNLCDAINTLTQIMKDPASPPQTRANCAVSVLQYGSKYIEQTDIVERLEAIEQIQKEDNEED